MKGLELKYFVLNPTKRDQYGYASQQAMLEFADHIQHVNPELAKSLRSWVKREQRISEGIGKC